MDHINKEFLSRDLAYSWRENVQLLVDLGIALKQKFSAVLSSKMPEV